MTAVGNLGPTQIAVSGRQVTLDNRAGSADSADKQKLRKAAGEFESILLASMWKSMKQSFGDSDADGATDPAHGTLEDWGIELMSSAVGKAGGLGIGKMILKHLEPEIHDAGSSDSAHFVKGLAGSADIARERRLDAAF